MGAQVINLNFIYALPKSQKWFHLLNTLTPTSSEQCWVQFR